MSPRRELLAFAIALAAVVAAFLAESLFGGKVLSPADVVYAQASFREFKGPRYEPFNRLLMDPVLQFEPWLEFNRAMLRQGRLPLWNSFVGCGAPHLANGQSAVFDPFHVLAYLGPLPWARGWIAATRLWVAGLGMFLLARSWGLGPWGCWFAGLIFPFCGFLIVWLQYPVTSVAIWMPWLLWTSDRVLERPRPRAIGVLALIAGCVLLGGHVQTSAHVLMAAALYIGWRWWKGRREPSRSGGERVRPILGWAAGMTLGAALAAIEIIPLGVYLSRSPVWADRATERPPFWALSRPRLLDAACTALPYLYGSQRRGHPNLARALGVHNLNESAGGFAGLATLVWLAPLAWAARRSQPHVGFLTGLTAIGALGAFAVPPVENLLRLIPVLDVTDNRRLTLWVAFGLVLLGGIGLDHLGRIATRRRWVAAWTISAIVLALGAAAVGGVRPKLYEQAKTHYARRAAETPGADPIVYRERAERQVSQALHFLPRYLLLGAGQGLAMVGLAMALRRGAVRPVVARGALLGLVLLDLFGFGYGLNPAIKPGDERPVSRLITYLRRAAPPPARVIAVGAELPPNTLMRYGLADARNYDSIELTRSLAWFAPLYEPEPGRRAQTSRRTITWQGVIRARDQLREANVRAVVGATPPPEGAFERVDRVGSVWIARLEGQKNLAFAWYDHGEIRIDARSDSGHRVVIPETFDPGWRAEIDGAPAAVEPYRGVFLAVRLPPGSQVVSLRYEPPEVWLALRISLAALAVIGYTLLRRYGLPYESRWRPWL
ncbi:MAG: hypothetical protein IRY99_00665 [Isosphaeraceae bacterium]|nr:hypothetical protein [Isosphaeraceae bacterium]